MLGNFYNWMGKKSVLVEIFGSSWEYRVPTDKEQQLYDFYMLAALLPQGIHLYLRPFDFGPEQNRMGEKDAEGKDYGEPARSWEDKVYYSLYEAADKLLPALKENLLKAVLFSLMAELRHTLDNYEDDYSGGHDRGAIKNLVSNIEKELGPQYAQMFINYTKRNELYKSPASALMRRVPINDEDLKTTHKKRKASYQAMLKSGGTPEQWATLAKYLFQHGSWQSSFGGPAWANIAEAWLELNKAKSASHVMGWIDRIYDLQHNTDTVFNKLDSYLKDGSYQWLKKALDHKRYIKSPYELVDGVSPPMKRLTQYAMWHLHRVSWEDFQKQKDKYDQEREEEINRFNSTHHGSSASSYDEPEVDKEAQALNYYIDTHYSGLSHYPKAIIVARLALHLPTGGTPQAKINKVDDLLKLNLLSAELQEAKAHYDVEINNEMYYENVGVNMFGGNYQYYYPKEALEQYNKYFENSPDVYLTNADRKRVIEYAQQHSGNSGQEATKTIRLATNYNGEASRALAYRTFLKAIISGELGQDYHEAGHQAKLAQLKKNALLYWQRNGSLPATIKLARAARGAAGYGTQVTPDLLGTVAEAIGLKIPQEQMAVYYKAFSEEQAKENYFDKATSYNGVYNRQQAYQIIEKDFKNAPLVKLDPLEEKQLEKMTLSSQQKIAAIKLFRENTGWSLRASKNYVEYLRLELAYLGQYLS